MLELSEVSKKRLSDCHPDLQRLIAEVVKLTPCAVICGHRGEKEQNEAFAKGASKAKFGQSLHNSLPSLAVDVVPQPLDWSDIPTFEKLGSLIMQKATELKIKIRWGKHFKGLVDYPHFELMK